MLTQLSESLNNVIELFLGDTLWFHNLQLFSRAVLPTVAALVSIRNAFIGP